VIDFHCHLDLYPNPQRVRDECIRRGLHILSVTTTPSAWAGTSALAGASDRIRTALGLHPQISQERRSELGLFDALLSRTRYVGEIGLDGAPEFRKCWQDQVDVFQHILGKCSEAGGRILSIHSRRASGAVLDLLEENPHAGTPILHWFSGGARDLDRAIRQGCWFSIGPVMLATENGRALACRMPPERVLTESDGPFAQINGKAAMPWDVEAAVNALALLWSTTAEEACRRLQSNLRALDELPSRYQPESSG
jgi:TatD DNase family protein